jgi:hypothetical protein
MAGIWGDILVSYPEQFETIKYFNQIPNINSGYTQLVDIDNVPIPYTNIEIIKQNIEPDEVTERNGNLVSKNCFDIWTMSTLTNGWFVLIDNEVFRVQISHDWQKQGGFIAYHVNKLTGDDGTLTNEVIFDTGDNNFA